jgi:hypothetical protein
MKNFNQPQNIITLCLCLMIFSFFTGRGVESHYVHQKNIDCMVKIREDQVKYHSQFKHFFSKDVSQGSYDELMMFITYETKLCLEKPE